MVTLKIKKLSNKAKIPRIATDGSACFDLSVVEDIMVVNGKLVRAHTGLAVEIPIGYCLEVYPRSGIASRGIIIPNAPAIIDADYRGEVKVALINVDKHVQHIRPGDRIAQLVICPVMKAQFVETELQETQRGSGGFGSTGIRAK